MTAAVDAPGIGGGVSVGWPSRRAALRIARREAWRHKGRSLLIVVMIALPVLGLTAADVIARSMQLTTSEKLTRSIGAAEAGLQLFGTRNVQQAANPLDGYAARGAELAMTSRALPSVEQRVLADLPRGTTLAPFITGSLAGDANGREVPGVSVTGLDLIDPVTAGLFALLRGAVPHAADQADISPALATRLGIGIGGTVTVSQHAFRVVGIVRDPGDLNGLQLVAPPALLPTRLLNAPLWLANTHGVAVTWPMVRRLNADGALVTSRAVVLHPPASGPLPPASDDGTRARDIGIATVAVGLAVLEVVLLAGAAFAVGARRQTHDLALVAATGADQQQVRDVVVGGGLVLGVTGAIAGAVLGVVAAMVALPVVQHLTGAESGGFRLRPLELLAAVVLGVVTGLLAAVLPARGAGKADVVAALTGRRGVLRTPRSVPIAGLLMAVFGAAVAAYSARPPAKFWLVLIGAVAGELGFVICAPAIVAAAARLAGWLPLPIALALRDGARHRGRTGPAVAAIMAAVAGITALAIYTESEYQQALNGYTPSARIGQTYVDLSGAPVRYAVTAAEVKAVLQAKAGVSGFAPVPTVQVRCSGSCPSAGIFVSAVTSGAASADPASFGNFAVGNADLLSTLLGHPDAAAVRALQAGQVVGLAAADGANTTGTVVMSAHGQRLRLPAYVVHIGRHQGALAGAVMSPVTARRLGLHPVTSRYAVQTAQELTTAQVDSINGALLAAHRPAFVDTERGYQDRSEGYKLLALLIAAALVTLGTTGVVTGLSAAESRPDLATFAAVGAAPRTRRILVASQAAVVGVIGTTTGVISGGISAWAIIGSYGYWPFVVPWGAVAGLAIGLPLLAGLLVGVLTRSQLPIERRWF